MKKIAFIVIIGAFLQLNCSKDSPIFSVLLKVKAISSDNQPLPNFEIRVKHEPMIHLGGEVTIITNANGEGSVELKSQLSKSSSDGISVKSSPKNGLIPISNADIYFSKEGEVKEVTIIFDRVVEQKIRLLLPTPGRNTFQVYSANYGNFRFDSDGFEEFYTPNHLISTNIQPIDTTVTVKRGKATSFYLSVSRIDPLPPNRIIKQLEYKFREARPDTTILVTY